MAGRQALFVKAFRGIGFEPFILEKLLAGSYIDFSSENGMGQIRGYCPGVLRLVFVRLLSAAL